MEKLHLVFGELKPSTLKALKREIKQYSNDTATDENIQKLFDINNTGIDIDIFPYMTYQNI